MTTVKFKDVSIAAEFFDSYRWVRVTETIACRPGFGPCLYDPEREVTLVEDEPTHIFVIRRGSECVCALPFTDFQFEVRAEEVLTEKREAHWRMHRNHYTSWDGYCSANNWWVTKVKLVT